MTAAPSVDGGVLPMFKRIMIIIAVVLITVGYFTEDVCMSLSTSALGAVAPGFFCLGGWLILVGIIFLITLLLYVFGGGCGPFVRGR